MRCSSARSRSISPYYPPRMGLAVDWYAANPSFHPIPAGYGLPWGRAEEEFIPSTLVQEAEFALAREQLKTQTPEAARRTCRGGMIAADRRQSSQRIGHAKPPAQRCAASRSATPALAWPALATTSTALAARLARSARLRPAAAVPRAARAAPAARADHDAHADLSRPGRKVYRAAGERITTCATTPASAAGPAIWSDRTISSAFAAICT